MPMNTLTKEIPAMRVKRLIKLRQWIKANPEHHDQRTWLDGGLNNPVTNPMLDCGTTGCLAGLAACMYRPELRWTSAHGAGDLYTEGGQFAGSIRTVAAQALGLNDVENHTLFVRTAGMGTHDFVDFLGAVILDGLEAACQQFHEYLS